jgi:hypothetical protein
MIHHVASAVSLDMPSAGPIHSLRNCVDPISISTQLNLQHIDFSWASSSSTVSAPALGYQLNQTISAKSTRNRQHLAEPRDKQEGFALAMLAFEASTFRR